MERGYCGIERGKRIHPLLEGRAGGGLFLGRKGADGGEGAITLIEVEAVSDNEFVLNDKADPASLDGANAFSFFAEENADLDGAGAEFFGVGAGAIEGEA